MSSPALALAAWVPLLVFVLAAFFWCCPWFEKKHKHLFRQGTQVMEYISKHWVLTVYLGMLFLFLLSKLTLHVFIYRTDHLIVFILSPETGRNEHCRTHTHSNRTFNFYCIFIRRIHTEEAHTCTKPVPDCLSLWWHPVNGTLCGPGPPPGHSTALVCLFGAHTKESRRPVDWQTAQQSR